MPDHKPGITGASADLNRYWTQGAGLTKWATNPKPWTTLVTLLTKYMRPDIAKGLATRYFHRVFGYYPGSDLNRVAHGKPPRGHKIGRG